jgi:hypothetical protein
MRISSVGTVWFREPLVWKRVELVAVSRTTTQNRRVFEVLPTVPAHLPPGQREASTYQTIAEAQPRALQIDDWF